MYIDRMTMAHARLAIGEAMRGYLFQSNINLIDFGRPEQNGQIVEEGLAIRFHVKKKLSDFALEAAVAAGATRPIVPSIGGFPTDVVEGTYRPHQWRWGNGWQPVEAGARNGRADPLRGGISISDERHYAYGTLGCLVVDRATGEDMILSNWHVLAADWSARLGQRIYQPGRLDGGAGADTVAALARDAMPANLDAAVARLTGSRRLINDQLELGPIRGVTQAELGMEVVKSGRRTGVTYGQVVAVEGVAKMNYASLDRIIRHVVTIQPRQSFDEVSGPGDSGSVWLDQASMHAVGLHFAGSNLPERALALDMQWVLDALNVDVVTTIGLGAFARVAPGQHAAPVRA